jgi:hypothetical protein
MHGTLRVVFFLRFIFRALFCRVFSTSYSRRQRALSEGWKILLKMLYSRWISSRCVSLAFGRGRLVIDCVVSRVTCRVTCFDVSRVFG